MKVLRTCLIGLLFLIPALSIPVTTITFDGLADTSTVGNTYQSQGVLFSGVVASTQTAGGQLFFSGSDWAGALSGATITFVHPGNPSQPAATGLVSWDTLGEGSLGVISGFTITAYDVNGNSLGSQTFGGGAGPLSIGTQSIAAAGIHHLVLSNVTGAGALGFDNLKFGSLTDVTPPGTPVPPSLWLAVTGCLVLLGYALWFRRRAVASAPQR